MNVTRTLRHARPLRNPATNVSWGFFRPSVLPACWLMVLLPWGREGLVITVRITDRRQPGGQADKL